MNQIKSGIRKCIDKLGKYELVYDTWGEAMSYDAFSKILADIEHQGPEAVDIPADFFAAHADADIVIGSFTPFTGENLSQLKNTHILGVMRAGLENIHIADATERGIAVINAAGRNADAVSDYAIGMMLSEARNIARSNYQIRSGIWGKNFPNSSCIPDMRGKTIGLFGFGQIGSRVAKKLSGFDVTVLVYDPFVKPEFVEKFGCRKVDKETLFRESDFISVHARLTADTFHVMSRELVKLSKASGKGAHILNVLTKSVFWSSSINNSTYVATKGAVAALTRNLAHELGKDGIHVNGIVPGYVWNSSMDPSSDRYKRTLAYIPNRTMATPQEMGWICAFLCSDRASQINGAIVDCSGGTMNGHGPDAICPEK